eukprot:9113502-Prorocentrum_lima.AAC.1
MAADGSDRPPEDRQRTYHRHGHTQPPPRNYQTPYHKWIKYRGELHPHFPAARIFLTEKESFEQVG